MYKLKCGCIHCTYFCSIHLEYPWARCFQMSGLHQGPDVFGTFFGC